jgi:GT2 family glycosyltransferase
LNTTNPDISIITVNYNGGNTLKRCVSSIDNHVKTHHEVIVFDNASSDGSIEALPALAQLRIIKSNENHGFAKGNNLAAAQAKGAWYHFLNPDILVNSKLESSYKTIFQGAENVMYVTSLTDENGHDQQMKMLIPTLSNYWRRLVSPGKAQHWSIGASIVLHRDTFEKLGGWSEDYFMYSEDLDLFYTAHSMGIRVVHLDTKIVHIGKVSSKSAWSAYQRAEVIEKSFKTFFRKHRSIPEYILVRILQLTYQLAVNRSELKYSAKAFFKTLFR